MSVLVLAFLSPMLFATGVIAGIFIRGIPMRGWMGTLLLVISAALWMFSQPDDSAAPGRTWLLPCFMLVAPFTVTYCFRARKKAPDRALATGAFFGSFIIAVAALLMLFGGIYARAFILMHPDSVRSILHSD